MYKFLTMLCCSYLILSKISAQDLATYIKMNAIDLKNIMNMKDDVYTALSTKKLIMIGELHGTQEPTHFVVALSELFAKHQDSILVGFEIPPDDMQPFVDNPVGKNIRQCPFFNLKSYDGRANIAWAEAINELSHYPQIKIFFFDTHFGESISNRDSIMYENIKSTMKLHNNWKVVTISGNIHAMKKPYNNSNTVGTYFSNDTNFLNPHAFCSLNFFYSKGTMYNNQGDSAMLHQVNVPPSAISEATTFQNYLLLYPPFSDNPNDGYLYTQKVTAAMPVNNKYQFK